jgi:uncharacterized membrane protein
MDTYELLLTLHILAAVIWVGGAFVFQILVTRADRSDEPVVMEHMVREAEFVGTRTFVPASLLLILSGFGLLAEGDWAFEPWLGFALAIWAASFLSGALFLGPESGRVAALIDAQGVTATAVRERIARLHLISRIELGLLLLVVIDMAVKPGL